MRTCIPGKMAEFGKSRKKRPCHHKRLTSLITSSGFSLTPVSKPIAAMREWIPQSFPIWSVWKPANLVSGRARRLVFFIAVFYYNELEIGLMEHFRLIIGKTDADDSVVRIAACIFPAGQKTVIIKDVLKGEM